MKKTTILLLTLLTACFMNKKDRYELYSSGNAPRLYPTVMSFGNFILSGGGRLYIPESIPFATDWGRDVSTHLLNSNMFSVPEGIVIVWLSLAENQFYSLKADLPKEKIKALLAEKNEATKEQKYNYIIVGMAPYGGLAVWLSGVGITTEVAWLQAEPTDMEFELFKPNTRFSNIEEFVDTYLKSCEKAYENYQKNGLPDRMLYENYMKKFNYRITPKFENEEAVFEEIDLDYYSGEYNHINCGEHVNNTMRAKPQKIVLEWSIGTDKYGGYFWTDENKIIETFANFYGDDTQKASSFIIEVGENNDKFKIYLQNENNVSEISLEDNIQMIVFKNRLECYRSPSYNKPPGGWRD